MLKLSSALCPESLRQVELEAREEGNPRSVFGTVRADVFETLSLMTIESVFSYSR